MRPRADTRGQKETSPAPRQIFLLLILLLAGCTAPISASRTSTRAAYRQMEGNALSTGKPSAETLSLLHRYDLDALFEDQPDEAVRQLHAKVAANRDRDALFSLAEMSFLAAEDIRRSVKPWDPREARDFYLGTAVYAYLYLFEQTNLTNSRAFDRRFRTACDFYNFGLGLALAQPKETNATVQLRGGKRRLPVGEINIELNLQSFPWPLESFNEFVLADQYLVRGLSVRNRQRGLGAPLIAVPIETISGIRTMTPATAFLRFDGSLDKMKSGDCLGSLELYSAFGDTMVKVGEENLPLETDLSVHMAYALNLSLVWQVHHAQFLSLYEVIPSNVYFAQPYEKGRIPVVFVHGTYSSPVWWAEMLNSLRADPVLRQRYQFWYFIYNSSAPMLVSGAKLRRALTERLKEIDPESSDAALQQMVVIGHSQGGLLTKLVTTETGDALWRDVSKKSIDELDLTPELKEEVRTVFYLEPLPFVKRAVFIATPHRGSYRAAGWVQAITRRLVSIPASLAGRARDLAKLATQLQLPKELERRTITSIDSMSPRNKVLITLADLPVAPQVKVNSIIPVKGEGDYHDGNDGVVEYKSAHVENVESELVVRHKHSCQDTPAVIEEVRRILHVHLESQGSSAGVQSAVVP